MLKLFQTRLRISLIPLIHIQLVHTKGRRWTLKKNYAYTLGILEKQVNPNEWKLFGRTPFEPYIQSRIATAKTLGNLHEIKTFGVCVDRQICYIML